MDKTGFEKLRASKRANVALSGFILSIVTLLFDAVLGVVFPEINLTPYMPLIIQAEYTITALLMTLYGAEDVASTIRNSPNKSIEESTADLLEVVADVIDDGEIEEGDSK